MVITQEPTQSLAAFENCAFPCTSVGARPLVTMRKRLSTMTVRSKAFAYAREPISITPPAPIRSRRPITPLTSARRALAVPLGPAIFDRGGLPFVVLSPLTYFIVIKYELPKPVS
jgi:hypothetical protein